MTELSNKLSRGLNIPAQPAFPINLHDWLQLTDGVYRVTQIDTPARRPGQAPEGPRLVLTGRDGGFTTRSLLSLYSDPALQVLDELTARGRSRRAAAATEADDEAVSVLVEKIEQRKMDYAALMTKVPDDELLRIVRLEQDILEYTVGVRSLEDLVEGTEPTPGYEPTRKIGERENDKAAELGLNPRTLNRLRNAYQKLGLWGLVDNRRLQPSDPTRNIPREVVAMIREQYLIREADGSQGPAVLPRIRRRVQGALDDVYGVGAFALPADSTLRDWISAISPRWLVERDLKTPRTQTADPETVFKTMKATRPGEVVFMDETPLDVKAYDPETGTIVDLSLVIILDLFSRSLIAWRLVTTANRADAVLMLADALTPMPLRTGWEDKLRFSALSLPFDRIVSLDDRLQDAAAKPVIWPERMIVDNGKIFISHAFMAACRRLRIDLTFAREAKPTDKPHVEAAFDTINEQFSQHVAGYTGGRLNKRGKAVESEARWSIDELSEMLDEYIVSIYQRRTHSGLFLVNEPYTDLSPNDVYALGVAVAGFVMAPPSDQLYYELLPIKWVKIHPVGVKVEYLNYSAPELGRFRHQRSPYPDAKGAWPVRWDPRDRLHVYFRSPDTGEYIPLRWRDASEWTQPFADGLLKHARDLVKKRTHKNPLEREVREELERLQNASDADERLTARDKKALQRSRTQARMAADDRHRHSAGAAPTAAQAHLDDDAVSHDPDIIDLSRFERWESYSFDPQAEGVEED